MFAITESKLIQDKETPALEAIVRLRALGLRIALDDFGTGHTGINYLHKLDFDYLKIDCAYTSSSDVHHAKTVSGKRPDLQTYGIVTQSEQERL